MLPPLSPLSPVVGDEVSVPVVGVVTGGVVWPWLVGFWPELSLGTPNWGRSEVLPGVDAGADAAGGVVVEVAGVED